MKRYVVTISKNCDEALSKIGTITYKPTLIDYCLFFSSTASRKKILKIDGVVDVRMSAIFNTGHLLV